MKSVFKFPTEAERLLKDIHHFAKARKVRLYLVGGILRDLLLKRKKENLDLDFCLKRGAISFGRSLNKKIKAGFVVLDKEHGACRLVKKIKDKTYTLDFTDFRGPTLEKDLLHRDFTINAIAQELGKPEALIDPYQGREDLKLKRLRVINKKAFVEDPLRILRAFSFSSILGFKIDRETKRLIKLQKGRLSKVSGERIRDELFKILDGSKAFVYLSELDRLGILKVIFPEIEMMRGLRQGPYHHLDVWRHTLETVKQLEGLIPRVKKNKDIEDYLNKVISADRRRSALIKLGALLHDIGKPRALRREDGKTKFHGHERIGLEMSENIIERLRLSNDELQTLKKMVLWHLRPGYLADNEELTKRAIFRYFRDAGPESVSVLLISIADQRATKGRLTTQGSRIQHEKVVFRLIREYFRRQKEKKLPRLINGDDLIKKFKLEPSPLIGKVLSEVEELQAIGKIKTRSEAIEAAGEIIAEG